jgi:hypothetical protein
MIAALFDVEGTLYTAQMGRGMLRYAREHGRRGAANRYYAAMTPILLFKKLKLMSDEAMRSTLWMSAAIPAAGAQANSTPQSKAASKR